MVMFAIASRLPTREKEAFPEGTTSLLVYVLQLNYVIAGA